MLTPSLCPQQRLGGPSARQLPLPRGPFRGTDGSSGALALHPRMLCPGGATGTSLCAGQGPLAVSRDLTGDLTLHPHIPRIFCSLSPSPS